MNTQHRARIGARLMAMAVIAALMMLLGSAAMGDVLTLKNGQVIEGKAVESGGQVTLATPNATIIYSKDEVAGIAYGPTPQETYARRAATLESTDAESHYQLGLYAESKGLIKEAADEYAKAIAADPNQTGAREKLGYVFENGVWITRDESMARRGYVPYKGRYVAGEEAVDAAGADKDIERSRDAYRLVRLLTTTIKTSSGQARADAEDKLAGIMSPLALNALIDATNDTDPAVRTAALRALGNYRENDAALAILDEAMNDPVSDIRYQAGALLNRLQNRVVFEECIRVLSSGEDIQRFHAADVLGALGDARAVPYLIDNLSWGRTRGPSPFPPPPMRPGEGVPFTQEYVVGVRAKVDTNAVAFEPIIAVNDIYHNRIILNPPQQDTWSSFPEGAPDVTLNYEAVSALQALTGQDFRFDRDAWQAWYLANANKLKAAPAAPQPGS